MKIKNGYSIVETMIAMAIILVLFVLGSRFITTGFKSTRFENEQNMAIEEARKALEVVEKNIRMASDSAMSDFAIKIADEQELIIYSNILENATSSEMLRFYIDQASHELRQVITAYDSASGAYNIPAGTSTLARYINNQTEPLFYYYDNNNATATANTEIRRIGFSIKINVTPAISPNDYYVESDVTLRNLKDNL